MDAKTFIAFTNSDRSNQSEVCGTWFSAKDGGSKLIARVKDQVNRYKRYIEYLEPVITLNPADLDAARKEEEILAILKNVSAETKNRLAQFMQ